MFAVIFEVQPRTDRWDSYLGLAASLRPELVAIDGFIDNVRYGSKRREGWVLSLSTWRDEDALARWRTHGLHHEVQIKGRTEVFRDYHLRVGRVLADTHTPPGQTLRPERSGETPDDGEKLLSIIEMRRPPDLAEDAAPEEIGRHLGLPAASRGVVEWDVFDAILTPGDLLALLVWRDAAASEVGERAIPSGARHRRIRVVRDYGMFRREEAPQYFPDVPTGSSR